MNKRSSKNTSTQLNIAVRVEDKNSSQDSGVHSPFLLTPSSTEPHDLECMVDREFLMKLSHVPVDAESLLMSAVNRSSSVPELSGALVEEELECITVEHLYDDHVMFMELI